ncbi:YopX family protein [Streptococcus pyogenes]|uniref:YopX family protein n=1 Tax=Streptococcus pyogenes TaxID=1314 RepID=UPI00109D5785|nr:YopX family protein [Streptococcus pyogenes]VHB88356.1 phage protein [Streptococcus pyogenes]
MIPKFRAYFEQYKRMIYSIGIVNQNMILVDFHDTGDTESLFITDRIHVMQSTGLFDKNGVEIFENDIVLTTRFIGRADENGGFYEYEKDYKGVVRMLEGAWVIGTGKDVVDLWTEADENEVIGNIHQNSDLLEEVEE